MWMNDDINVLTERRKQFVSYQKTFVNGNERRSSRILVTILAVLILFLFLPWTQNISAPGVLTTLRPQQRPQQLNTIIAGRIEKWYVKEGDIVNKGDTIIKITEVKEDYLDPDLLKRTDEQLVAKENTVDFYRDKVDAIQLQIKALYDSRELKLSQLKNKIQQATFYVQSDSMSLEAAKTEFDIAKQQYDRMKGMYDQGLSSLTDLERRKQTFQNAQAKMISAENKLLAARQELINARIELNATDREYSEKISKAESDKFSTLSQVTGGEGEIAKLKNQYNSYAIRNAFYFITAPQDGQVTKTIKAGIGEIIKEGELVAMVTPTDFDRAVEMYVNPIDLPLIYLGDKVRFQFDGWPAIVFTGWPNVSFGTFGGKVVAIDNNISDNGKFRILVAEDKDDRPWPKQLRVGGGAKGLALLKTVPIWYELWRQINGFPPDFYVPQNKPKDGKK